MLAPAEGVARDLRGSVSGCARTCLQPMPQTLFLRTLRSEDYTLGFQETGRWKDGVKEIGQECPSLSAKAHPMVYLKRLQRRSADEGIRYCFMVPGAGIELARPYGREILSLFGH